MEAQMANGLTMRWIPVADASGRLHMEAVWITEIASADVPVATTYAA
jgi:hypothetical protein